MALVAVGGARARRKWSSAFGGNRPDPEAETPTKPSAPPQALTATTGVEVAVVHPPRSARGLFVPAIVVGLVLTAMFVGAWHFVISEPAPSTPRAATTGPAPCLLATTYVPTETRGGAQRCRSLLVIKNTSINSY